MICNACQSEKPPTAFYPYSLTRCKDCCRRESREYQRRRYHADADFRRRQARQNRQRWRKVNYGLSDADFARILAAQGFGWAICKTEEPKGRHNQFHIDHDHITGRVRGLLCSLCNTRFLPMYEALPPECRDSPRLNAYLRGAETGADSEKGD